MDYSEEVEEEEVEEGSPRTHRKDSNQQSQQPVVYQTPKQAPKGGPPETRVTKTGKVQELVAAKAPALPDPIRGMLGRQRCDVGDIMALPIQLTVGELLDRSDTTIKELAFHMQRATPRYRIKRQAKTNQAAAQQAGAVIAAAVPKEPPEITAHAYDDDGQSQPLMMTAWIGSVNPTKTLLDGGSTVELVNRRKLQAMTPQPRIHTDGHLRVSLATDAIHALTNYAWLPINVEGVQAAVKAYLVDNQVYDLLLGVPWMRRVGFHPNYGTGQVTISGDDGIARHVPAQTFPMHANLPTVEIDEEEDEQTAADAACQLLLDEQGN